MREEKEEEVVVVIVEKIQREEKEHKGQHTCEQKHTNKAGHFQIEFLLPSRLRSRFLLLLRLSIHAYARSP